MKLLKGFALRGKIAVAAFALTLGAGALGALIPQTHAAFAESETQATVPASTEEKLEQTPRAEGDAVEIEAPKLVSKNSVSYDGEPHTFIITGYNDAEDVAMSIALTGDAQESELGSVITYEATEAYNYKVTFSIDGNGYVFKSGDNVSSDKKSATIEFSITQATDQTIDLDEDYSFVYGEAIKIVPTLTYPVKDSAITIAYYEYDNANGGPKGDSLGAVPTNAGVYYVIASVSRTSNYNYAEAGAVVVIEKKELKVSTNIPSFYGQRLSASEITYKISGFAYGDTAESCVTVNLDQVAQGIKCDGKGAQSASVGKYMPAFATNPVPVNAYKGKTANSIYGFSKKGNADNYYFTAADSCLVDIRPLPVSVVIGNITASFGSIPQYNSNITLRWADSVANKKIPEADRNKQDEELKKLLNVTSSSFLCTAKETSDVGYYPIRIVNGNNETYSVTYVDGIYEIVPASLVVEWSEGGGSYGNVTEPKISSIHALIGGVSQNLAGTEFEQPVYAGLSFRFTDLTGNQSFEKGEVPANAGNYSVELTFTTEGRIGKNYVLSSKSAASRRFSISKLLLDVEKLRVDDSNGKLEYNNGNVIVPTLAESGFEEYFNVKTDEAKVAGTYYITLTLKDFDNMQWSVGKTAEYKVPFIVAKAKNKIIGSIYAEGWTYGDTAKIPSVDLLNTKDISDGVDIVPIFEYSSDNGTNWTNVVPTAAGNYLVRATTKATTNVEAFASMSATPFTIARKAIAKPRLDVTTANNVYTGDDLHAGVSGFNQTLMTFTYKGSFTVEGNDIALTVRNAGSYKIVIELVDSNYVWADGDKASAFEQTWTVAPKRIEKPTAGDNAFPTIDKIITYLPDGFDETTMTITGNEAGYNGTFTAEISLKDSANYVWDDGSVESIRIDWKIGGVNTAFVALVTVFALLAALGVGAGIAQYLFYKRKQKREAEATDEEQSAETEEANEGGEQA